MNKKTKRNLLITLTLAVELIVAVLFLYGMSNGNIENDKTVTAIVIMLLMIPVLLVALFLVLLVFALLSTPS